MTEPRRAPHLPKVHPAAWHGALGEAVRKIAPMTEADPIAILVSALALFGAVAGDGPHVRVGGVRHPPRLWPLIVGKTGSGRKGTSWAEAKRLGRGWSDYAGAYVHKRVATGLSSGEGLIASLGGGATAAAAGKDGPQQEPLAPDGRLTAMESEFARVLSSAKRDGSTLGPILRQLWDDGTAAIMTRNAPLQVEGAHLVVVAHVTPRELRLRLAESDLAGGTLNRFLLIGSERPHLLAHELDHPDVSDEAKWLGKALESVALRRYELRRDREADELWPEVYSALNASEPDGQLGSVLARGPAYTMRLALAYALADGAGAIGPHHLLAGLAVWHYSAQTARLVFPEAKRLDDMERLAAFIVAAGGGRTRTEISTYFARNKTGAELAGMVDEMKRHGQVVEEREERTAGPGRPTVRYRWIGEVRDPMGDLLSRYSGTN